MSHLATPWTIACQASLSVGFPRQECWSGQPCPSAEDLPDLGIEPGSPARQVDSLPLSYREAGAQACYMDGCAYASNTRNIERPPEGHPLGQCHEYLWEIDFLGMIACTI